MKLNDLCAYLVPMLDQKMSDFTELVRALKEGSAHFDPDAELHKAVRAVAEASYDRELMNAKPGPRGGLEATPFRTAFLLTALMITEVPRREIADATWRIWHLSQEGSLRHGHRTNNPRPNYKPCPLTGRFVFGDAFKAVMENKELADRVNEIEVDSTGRTAEITYDTEKVSRFSDGRPVSTGLHRRGAIDGTTVRAVAALVERAS